MTRKDRPSLRSAFTPSATSFIASTSRPESVSSRMHILGSSTAIRTFVADGERLTLHVGGGITWRSDPEAEWSETVAKASGPLSSIGAVEIPA